MKPVYLLNKADDFTHCQRATTSTGYSFSEIVNTVSRYLHHVRCVYSQSPQTFFVVVAGILVSSLHLNVFYYSHDTPKWFVFDIATSLYVIYSLRTHRELRYGYAGLLSVALVYLMLASLWIASHKIAGLEFTLRFLNAILFSYCVLLNFSRDRLTEVLLETVFWSALTFSLIFVVERYIIKMEYNAGSFSPAGYINNAGALFNLWIPGLVLYIYQNRRHKHRVFWGAASLLVVVAILMEAATRGTIIGLSISELIVFAMMLRQNVKRSLMFLSITTLLLAGVGIYQVSDSLQNGRLSGKITLMQQGLASASSGRLDMFANTVEMVIDNPLGVGINNFEYIHPKYARPGSAHASPFVDENNILRTPHNIVLKLYSELGYLGGTLFSLLLLYILITACINAWVGGYVDKWLFVGVCATLIHTMLSAVLLTPASLFFSCLLFATVNARFIGRRDPKRSFMLRLPVFLKVCYLAIPVLAVVSALSEYYGYQGRINFDDKYLERAILLNPGNDRALLNLSQVRLHRQKNVRGSLEAVNKFLHLYPYHIYGLMLKAERHYQLGEFGNAQSTLQKLLAFYPGYGKAQRLRQLLDIKMKQQY